MTDASHVRLSRRRLLELGGGATAGALGAGVLAELLRSPGTARAGGLGGASGPVLSVDQRTIVRRSLAGTDGWIYLGGPPQQTEAGKAFFPDDMAPAPQNVYVYGFRDVTSAHLQWNNLQSDGMPAGMDDAHRTAGHDALYGLKGQTQNSSVILFFDEGDQVEITLYNLGWQQRPDIPDGHTIHWHGFRDAIPWYDGVPEMSGAAPINKTFTYFYDCQIPGTYMYHCHWEDVEHIQMGMTGAIWIRPKQNLGVGSIPPGKYVYNDGNGSTAYDREYAWMLMDYDLEKHQMISHIQQPDWHLYQASGWMINGRSYPDTIEPQGVAGIGTPSGDAIATGVVIDLPTVTDGAFSIATSSSDSTTDVSGQLAWVTKGTGAGQVMSITSGTPSSFIVDKLPYQTLVTAKQTRPDDVAKDAPILKVGDTIEFHRPGANLVYQPNSALVAGNAGDRVLVRIACLGYQDHSMTIDGLPFRVVGRDGDWLADNEYRTDVIDCAPGESYDAIITLPAHSGGTGPDVYMFYDRDLPYYNNDDGTSANGFNGMATEVRVFAAGSLPSQHIDLANSWVKG